MMHKFTSRFVIPNNMVIGRFQFYFIQLLIISLKMNNNFMLQNLIQNGSSTGALDHKMKKGNKMASHELQLLVGTVFNQVCQILDDHNIPIQIPEEVTKITDKVNLFKSFIEQLIQGSPVKQKQNQGGIISCVECQNYEASLQKVENDVKKYIRLKNQFSICQDSMEDKIEENKKEKKELQKKIEGQKKQLEDLKKFNNTITEKLNKLQAQNEQLKIENRQLKRSVSTNQEVITTNRQSHKSRAYAYQAKQNKIDWVHRNVSLKRQDKEKQYERKSIEKKTDRNQKNQRSESAQKNWRLSANTKSSKMISIMNQKLVQDKGKEERRKVIQSKLEYRR